MIAHRVPVRDDIGQAFVELALVLPIFILLVLGGAEVGRLAYADIEISNAARAGVAYAMQSSTLASDGPGIRNAAKQDAPDIPNLVVDNNGPPTLTCYCETAGVATAKSCTTINTDAGSCPSPSIIAEYVQVNTSASINTAFHFLGIPNPLTLQGQAIMRVER
jgi:Flp pilus assembly protein TadG